MKYCKEIIKIVDIKSTWLQCNYYNNYLQYVVTKKALQVSFKLSSSFIIYSLFLCSCPPVVKYVCKT